MRLSNRCRGRNRTGKFVVKGFPTSAFASDPNEQGRAGAVPRFWPDRCKYGRIGKTWQSYFGAGKGEGRAMADAEDEILTLDEVAAYLKAGKRTVYRLAADKNSGVQARWHLAFPQG